MSERKDKKKVIGEPMTDEQIRFFLNGEPEAGVNGDFHKLQRAYRSLRAEDFERFVGFFVADGGNINAQGPDGKTMAQIIGQHPRFQQYLSALQA